MLLLMATEAPSPTGRLTPSFLGRISRRGSKAPSPEDPNPGGLLVPRQTSRSSDSEGSRSIRSIRSNSSNARNLIRKISTRFKRSPSSATLDGLTPLMLCVDDFKQGDIHNWKLGFSKYNQLVTNQISKDHSYQSDEFTSICKALTKQCGEGFVHGLPEAVFDFALLWCPTGKLVRKEHPSTEPSWSWTGWEGAGVNFPFDPTSCPDIRGEEGNLFKSEVLNYHLGPESTPWTIRRERKQALKIQYIPYFHAPKGLQRPVEEADTLRFSAFTVSATDFSTVQLMNDNEEELPYCELKDDKGQHCGNIMDYRSLVLAQDDKERTFEYVLLSRNRRFPVHDNTKRPALNTAHPPGTPIWDNDRFLWDQTLEDFDADKFEEREWCMLNVMLVEHQEEGWAERVAIGQIHEDAWNALNPVKKDICLR